MTTGRILCAATGCDLPAGSSYQGLVYYVAATELAFCQSHRHVAERLGEIIDYWLRGEASIANGQARVPLAAADAFGVTPWAPPASVEEQRADCEAVVEDMLARTEPLRIRGLRVIPGGRR